MSVHCDHYSTTAIFRLLLICRVVARYFQVHNCRGWESRRNTLSPNMSKSVKRTFATLGAAKTFQEEARRNHNRPKPSPSRGPSPRVQAHFEELRNIIRDMQEAVSVRQTTVDEQERATKLASTEIDLIEVKSETEECIVHGCKSCGIYRHAAFKGILCALHLSHASRPTPMLFECACDSCEVVLDYSNPVVSHIMGRIRLCQKHMKLQHDQHQCPNCPLMCKVVGYATCVKCRVKGIKRRK